MFGLISKKRVAKELQFLRDEYDDCNKDSLGLGRVNYMYYSFGNMNAVNSLASRLGIKIGNDAKIGERNETNVHD